MGAAAAHARRSPSSSFRWLRCKGSINLIAAIGADTRSEAAAEGTAAHQIRAECMEYGFEPHDFVGQKITVDDWTFEVDDFMANCIVPGVERLRTTVSNLHVEHRVDLGRWLPGDFGTLDAGGWNDEFIDIDDFKYGRIAVSPHRNEQLMIYAFGFWDQVARHHTAATKFRINVDQPRSSGGGGEWTIVLDDLMAFASEVEAAGIATIPADAPRTPSSKACAYCPGAEFGRCPEFTDFSVSLWSSKFDEIDQLDALGLDPILPSPAGLTPERRSFIARHRRMITSWFDHLVEWELADALAGRATPGRKPIAGKLGNRKWIDEKAAEAAVVPMLGDSSFTKKLKSPTQVEKAIGPDDYAEIAPTLVTRDEGRPVMVDENDARPALLSAQSKFDEEEG